MQNTNDFNAECDLGPRLNQFAEFFSQTAAGKTGVPFRKPVIDRRLLPPDPLLHRIIDLHSRRQGNFDQHYHGSIPYRLEEECRMAHAIFRYTELNAGDVSLYSLGTAEGTMARTLSELSRGRIRSLSCSPNEENHKCFMAYGEPPHAHFFHGPFHRLTKDYLCSEKQLEQFSGGFDFILEDTTFQMYSPNRGAQIEFVARHLKSDGIFLFLEKFRAIDQSDYDGRESQKDFGFKTRYFAVDEIRRKREQVLSTMNTCEVTLPEMATAVFGNFKHCAVTWNSGNFYGLAASNSKEHLQRYLSQMVHPAIPTEYEYEPGPYTELSEWLNLMAPLPLRSNST
jgi:hypothetical protein